MKVTVHAAKTNLSKLIEAALAGEEVIIARGDKPAVRLVPVESAPFKFGLLKGRLGETPDFLEPMSEQDLADWESRDRPQSCWTRTLRLGRSTRTSAWDRRRATRSHKPSRDT